MKNFELFLADEQVTEAFGFGLAKKISVPLVIYLNGNLGAGKTTLVRGLLKGLGHKGSTKSPTYTLVEPYLLNGISVYHFDLYRLADPEELEYIGIREYQTERAILIFEWPEQGRGWIPDADLMIHLEYHETGRSLKLQCLNDKLANDWQFDDILCQNEMK